MSAFKEYPFREIPALRPLDWKEIFKVLIEESGEPLVPVSLYPEKILARSIYFREGYEKARPELYLRKGVYECLVRAADSLPTGYKLVVYDGWRPVPLQLSLFDEYVRKLSALHPEKGEEELKNLASMYVAVPSTDPRRPSPHSTGASVDLTLADGKGRLLSMGGRFDEKSKRSETRYYEDRDDEPSLKQHRRLLYHVMISAGFTNYPEEWWHYDCGNQNWVYFSGGADGAGNMGEAAGAEGAADGPTARYGIVPASEQPYRV